jgi:hypothetical protein
MMTAIKLMNSILTAPDPKPRLALLGRLLYPLLGTEEQDKRERWSEQVLFPVSDGELEGVLTLQADFAIADWSLVPAVMKANVAGELDLWPCGLVDDTGDHDALVVLVRERPVMTAYASGKNTLTVRVGGFDDSGVVHDGTLMALSRDAASTAVEKPPLPDRRDRRRNTPAATRARKGKKRRARARLQNASGEASLAVPLPRIVIRAIGSFGDAVRETVQPVLHRDRPPRLDENGLAKSGPAHIGVLADHVRAGLGVHVLQTSHALRNLGFTKRGADDKIAQELVGGELGVGPLMQFGRTALSEWTGFDSEDELALFASSKYTLVKKLGFSTPMPDRRSQAQAELANIQPLSLTYSRAKNVLRAFGRAGESSQNLAKVEIRAAYAGIGASFSTRNLIEIAMTADVNPIPLWPSHSEVSAGTFEVLRFIGRIQRGTNAVLLPVHFGVARQALARKSTERTVSETVIAETVCGFFDRKVFIEALDMVEDCGGALVVARRTRDLAVGQAVPRPVVPPRAQATDS